MITIPQQAAAILPVLQAVSGFATVRSTYPETVTDRELPLLVLQPGEATYDRRAGGAFALTISRRWRAHIFAQRVTAGREASGQEALFGLVLSVITALGEVTSVSAANGEALEIDLHSGRDTGIQIANFGDVTDPFEVYATTVEFLAIDSAHVEPDI